MLRRDQLTLASMLTPADKTMPNINTFATLSPIPTLTNKFDIEPEDIDAVNDWLSQRKDPVARFHLRNGAKLHRVNRSADKSNLRMKQSHGIMVNYQYHL